MSMCAGGFIFPLNWSKVSERNALCLLSMRTQSQYGTLKLDVSDAEVLANDVGREQRVAAEDLDAEILQGGDRVVHATVADVGYVRLVHGRGHGDDNVPAFAKGFGISRETEVGILEVAAQRFASEIDALPKFLDAARVDVEADDRDVFGEGCRQRQTDIAEADNRDFSFDRPHDFPTDAYKTATPVLGSQPALAARRRRKTQDRRHRQAVVKGQKVLVWPRIHTDRHRRVARRSHGERRRQSINSGRYFRSAEPLFENDESADQREFLHLAVDCGDDAQDGAHQQKQPTDRQDE